MANNKQKKTTLWARDVRVSGVSDVPVRGRGADEYLLSSRSAEQSLSNCGKAFLCAPV